MAPMGYYIAPLVVIPDYASNNCTPLRPPRKLAALEHTEYGNTADSLVFHGTLIEWSDQVTKGCQGTWADIMKYAARHQATLKCPSA